MKTTATQEMKPKMRAETKMDKDYKCIRLSDVSTIRIHLAHFLDMDFESVSIHGLPKDIFNEIAEKLKLKIHYGKIQETNKKVIWFHLGSSITIFCEVD